MGTTTITIDPPTDLSTSASYYILIDAGAFEDLSGNTFTGISDPTTLNFTTEDTTAPVITAIDETVDVADLAAWTETVSASDDIDGDITSNIVTTYFEGNGTTALTDLAAAKTYIDNASTNTTFVIKYNVSDASLNAAIEVIVTITVTPDTTAPTLTSSAPADNATDVAINVNIVLTFSEAVDAETGNIELRKTSDESLIESFDVTTGITGTGTTTIIINPTASLLNSTGYYVLIDATAFDDAAGNSYGGIASQTALSFTTVAAPSSGGGGGGGGGAPAPYVAPLKSQAPIVLTSSVGTIEFGGLFKITTTGGESTGALTYSSSGDALCAVDASGNVTALGKGTCTITATKAGDSTYASVTSNSVTVTVTDITVAGVVAVGEVIAPTLSISKPVAGTTTLRFKIDSIYSGDRVSVLLGNKVNGKTTYKTLGSATVTSSGAVTFKSKVKFNKGNLVRLKYGSTVIITKTV